MSLLLSVVAVTACGKKGPPLTPFVLTPTAASLGTPRRVGADIYVPVTLPADNLDGSTPAALVRVDVYGVTSLVPPPRARFLEIATLVGSIPVASSGLPGEAAPLPPDPSVGALQGTVATLRDPLSTEDLTPRSLPVLADERRQAPLPIVTAPAALPAGPRRFYMAVTIGPRSTGPPSQLAELPLVELPEAPDELAVTLAGTVAALRWEPSAGLIGWLLARSLSLETSPVLLPSAAPTTPAAGAAATAAGPTTYNVYRERSRDPLAPPAVAGAVREWELSAPVPVNTSPLNALSFDDVIVLDDLERCYTVRAVRGAVESEPSPRRCIRAIDVVPPAAPVNVFAIAGDGVITLSWEPNAEQDLAGYIVLRTEGPGDRLVQLPLTTAPIAATQFVDRNVRPGTRYTYEVRAVDSRIPLPNMSEPATVSETAR